MINDTLYSPLSPLILHASLENIDCLFFIHYLPADTIKPRWFLVQVNHLETTLLKMNPSTTGDYHVTFFLVIPMITTSVMMLLVGGLSGMNNR